MKIERFEIPGLAQYSYVISSQGEAAVIDPIRDIDRYLRYAAANDLKITQVLETHIHADFASGSIALAAAAGVEPAFSAYDRNELYQYAMPHRSLAGGDTIAIGQVQLRVLHTPGHTPEHISFLLSDSSRPIALFSGDFLFFGSLGRPDLLGEAETMRLARLLYQSLHGPLQGLPDHVEVYPGHGAGSFCGSGMSHRAESTVGFERAANDLFTLPEDAFVKRILGSLPPLPSYYPRMKRLNAAGAPALSPLPGSSALSAKQLAARLQEPDLLLLDLRQPDAFGSAHIPGAINIGAGPNLPVWAGWLLDPKRRIILIGDGSDEEESRRALLRVGLDRLEGYLDHGMQGWINEKFPISRITPMSMQEVADHFAENRSAGMLLLDVRTDDEWHNGHIANAQHIPLDELPHRLRELSSNLTVIPVCGSGYRAAIAASLLKSQGFADVRIMTGGIAAWKIQGLPLT